MAVETLIMQKSVDIHIKCYHYKNKYFARLNIYIWLTNGLKQQRIKFLLHHVKVNEMGIHHFNLELKTTQTKRFLRNNTNVLLDIMDLFICL